MTTKRYRRDGEGNVLMLLSGRVFGCKTCDRQFPTFQALGGHRASHKKAKVSGDEDGNKIDRKPKVHECSVCGIEFAIGQALGGHMRRHRGDAGGFGYGFVEKEKRVRLNLNLPPSEMEEDGEERQLLGLGLGLGICRI